LAKNEEAKRLNQKIVNLPSLWQDNIKGCMSGKEHIKMSHPRCGSQKSFKDGRKNIQVGKIQQLTKKRALRGKIEEVRFVWGRNQRWQILHDLPV
jgi:hypothetical protein